MLESVDRSEEPDEWCLRLRDKTLGNAFETNLTSTGLARRDDAQFANYYLTQRI